MRRNRADPRKRGFPRVEPRDLYASPNAIAHHYLRFKVSERILLSGHSHQAWPDVALGGLEQAYSDAAELVDGKWDRADEVAQKVKDRYRTLLGDRNGHLTLVHNTFDGVVRFLSALPLAERPKIVSTDGEFYSLRRLLARLGRESFVEVVRVPAAPVESCAERLADAVCDRTSAVLASSVLFGSGRIVPGLDRVLKRCEQHGARLLIDAYHQLNVVSCDLAADGLEGAYFTGAGYKYLQFGEGVGFLRSPAGCQLEPVITGWFAEFSELTGTHGLDDVVYPEGDDRFAGATYDPVSHYRAAAVIEFFENRRLKVELLREVSQHQVGLLIEGFDALDLDAAVVRRDSTVSLEQLGGFLALHSPRAEDLHLGLKARGVWTDSRGHTLRLGPAPYLSDRQIEDGVAALGEVVHSLE